MARSYIKGNKQSQNNNNKRNDNNHDDNINKIKKQIIAIIRKW